MSQETEFFTRAEFAEIVSVTPAALADWEKRGVGPAPLKVGPRTNLYRKEEVRAFLAERASSPSPLILAERARLAAFYALVPEGSPFGFARDVAIREGMSTEAFTTIMTCVEEVERRRGVI